MMHFSIQGSEISRTHPHRLTASRSAPGGALSRWTVVNTITLSEIPLMHMNVLSNLLFWIIIVLKTYRHTIGVNRLNKEEVQRTINEHKAYIAEAFSVEKIGLFGSFARDEYTEESDIDLLVEFKRPVGFEFIELKEYLESLFQKPVDLVTVNALRPFMKEQVMNEVQFQ